MQTFIHQANPSRVVFGLGTLARLPDEVERLGARRALILSTPEQLASADVELAAACAECGSSFEIPFDIGSFLLREVEVWAGRVLREVHVLAREYGWDETAILRLSPRRRRSYLDLIGASA